MEKKVSFKLGNGLCRYGQMSWPAEDEYLGRSLSIYGEWAQNEIDFAAQFIPSDATVLDIGGNIGTHAVAFSRLAPAGKIISIEPHKELFILLKNNISNCNCTNVEPINFAASSKSIQVGLSVNTPGNFGDFKINSPSNMKTNLAMITGAITIDSLNLGKVDFIKIDVEGHEVDVVEGAARTIQKFKPVVLSEILSINNGLLLFKQFNDLGYDTYFVSFNPFSENNYKNSYKNIFQFTIETMLLFLPSESPPPMPDCTQTVEKVSDGESLAAVFIKEKDISTKVRAKLYFSTKDDFCEDASIPCMVDAGLPGSKVQFRFKLPQEPLFTLMLSLPEARCAMRYLRGCLISTNGCSITLFPDVSDEDHCSGSTYYWTTKKPNLVFTQIPKGIYETAIFEIELLLYGTVDIPAIEYLIKLELKARNDPNAKGQEHLYKEFEPQSAPGTTDYFEAASGKYIDAKNFHNVEKIRKTLEPYFDENFYLDMYPDIKSTGLDALDHYIETGWLENRDPHSGFSTSYYLEQFPSVADSGMNPFYHWVLSGRPDEHNRPCTEMQKILIENNRIKPTVLHKRFWEHLTGMSSCAVAQAVVERIDPANPRLALAFGHDNYLITVGGVQIITALDQKKLSERSCTYLQLHPVIAHPNLIADSLCDHYMLGMILEGQFIGLCRGKEFLEALGELATKTPGLEVDLIIHALLGHSVKLITLIKERLAVITATYWVHDYYSICPCYNLLRNNIIYCDAPSPKSAACGACLYGEDRKTHLEMMNRLFGIYNFTVVAPSQSAIDLWLDKSTLPHKKAMVISHLSVLPDGGIKPEACGRPLRTAFLGLPRFHKGWTFFADLVRELGPDIGHQFYLLGKENKQSPSLIWEKVEVMHNAPGAMRGALRRLDIDIVVIWSVWPETFCIAAYEALAAGCRIITGRESGNVAAIVRENSQGTVYGDGDELIEAFKSGQIVNDTLDAQKCGIPTGELSYNNLTAEVIFPKSGETI